MKFWVNIDKPSECYLHTDSCSKVPRDTAQSKEAKAGGNWVSFNSREEAADFLAKRFPDKSLFAHYCIQEHQ
ncbi:hypothetical protein GX563_11635 [Candidatus Bathyarchaeota archaeon]|nr:hypothetical protein [Candidatus Bathyarchaeota archaeon]